MARAYAVHGEAHYYGTRDGVWLKTDQDEARIWGQPRQAVTGLAVRDARLVIAAANMLFTGSADDSATWRELGRAAFVPEPANDWQHLRVLSRWFVARSSKGFYASENGARWEKITPENKQILGVGAGAPGLWVVASEPGKPGYVLGRSEDLRTWTWSEPLPEHFKPGSPVFPVIGEGVAVLAGSYASRGEMFNVPQALLSFHWPHEGPARWQIAAHAMPSGGSLIEVAQMGEDAWARLPNGDLAASVNGFDWIRVGQNPLGTANAWFLSDNPANDYLLLAANDGRYLWLYPDALEYAGRGGAAAIAWQEVKGSVAPATDDAPVTVASIAQEVLDRQKADARAVSELMEKHPAAAAKPAPAPAPATVRPPFQLFTTGEGVIRNMDLAAAETQPEGPARKQALDAYHRKWDEKLRFRQLAEKLYYAAAMPDTEANGMARSATLLGISRTEAALFGKTPEDPGNRLMLPSLLSVAQNRIPREQHAEVLDRILRDVPTLADVWVLRAGFHIEAGEWDLAEGTLAVARMLNPNEPSLEKMETRLDAQRPALTNADLIRQRMARSWQEAEESTDDMLRSADPAADYATGLEFEQGTRGRDIKERIDKAQFHYLKAALADHVPAMLGYVRAANASLQQPDVSEATRAAVEKGIVQWVNKAADLGNGEALRVRALWRANGQAGLTADRGLAWVELERAAEAGDWPAMRMLAQAAHAGEWGRQDFKTVENWLERAQAAGDPEASRMLEELRKQHKGGKK